MEISPEMIEYATALAFAVLGMTLKSYFPVVWPFFDRNRGTIEEFVELLANDKTPDKKIYEKAGTLGLNLVKRELENSVKMPTVKK